MKKAAHAPIAKLVCYKCVASVSGCQRCQFHKRCSGAAITGVSHSAESAARRRTDSTAARKQKSEPEVLNERWNLFWQATSIGQYHAQYLAMGGLDVLIGDGKLRYGPEYVWEAYYSARLFPGFFATFS